MHLPAPGFQGLAAPCRLGWGPGPRRPRQPRCPALVRAEPRRASRRPVRLGHAGPRRGRVRAASAPRQRRVCGSHLPEPSQAAARKPRRGPPPPAESRRPHAGLGSRRRGAGTRTARGAKRGANRERACGALAGRGPRRRPPPRTVGASRRLRLTSPPPLPQSPGGSHPGPPDVITWTPSWVPYGLHQRPRRPFLAGTPRHLPGQRGATGGGAGTCPCEN